MLATPSRIACIFILTFGAFQSARAQIQATSGATTSLGTAINGQIGGTCLTGSCIITGGVTAGQNTFHRFDFFKANVLNGITSVTFDGTPTNGTIFASILSETTSLNAPISISNTGSLVFLSPNGINIGNSFSLSNVTNLVLTTANSVKFTDQTIFFVDSTSSSDLASYDSDFAISPASLSSKLGDKTSSSVVIAGGSNPSDSQVNIFVHQSLYIDTLGDITIANTSIQSDPFLVGSTESYAYLSSGGSISVDLSSSLVLNSYTSPSLFYSISDVSPSPTSPQLLINSSSFIAALESDNYTTFLNPSFKSSSTPPSETIPEPPSNNQNTPSEVNDLPADTPADDSTYATTYTSQNEQPSDEAISTEPQPSDEAIPTEPQPIDLPATDDLTTDETITIPPVDETTSSEDTPEVEEPPAETTISSTVDPISDQGNPQFTELLLSTDNSSSFSPQISLDISTTASPESSVTTSDPNDSDTNNVDQLGVLNDASNPAPMDQQVRDTQPNTTNQTQTLPASLAVTPSSPVILSPKALDTSFTTSSVQQTIDTTNTLGLPPQRIPSSQPQTPSDFQQTLQSIFTQINAPLGL